jgi:hypothetical protein
MIEISEKSKKHIQDSFIKLFNAVSEDKEAFSKALDEYDEAIDPIALLDKYLPENQKKKDSNGN